MSIIVFGLIASVASPIDFLLDTNAVAFIGLLTVLTGLVLPVVAIRAGSRREPRRAHGEIRASDPGEYSKQLGLRFLGDPGHEEIPAKSSVSVLGPDQHGMDRVLSKLPTDEIFHVGAIHRLRTGEPE